MQVVKLADVYSPRIIVGMIPPDTFQPIIHLLSFMNDDPSTFSMPKVAFPATNRYLRPIEISHFIERTPGRMTRAEA
jgi:hypothetical protein